MECPAIRRRACPLGFCQARCARASLPQDLLPNSRLLSMESILDEVLELKSLAVS
jgi:hypothetical protein